MKSLLRRLDIYVLGDRQFVERPMVRQSTKRQQRHYQSAVEIPDHARQEQHRIRMLRAAVEAGPNTPLLKRLNRNPQSLDCGYFGRRPVQRMTLQERPRAELSNEVREELRRPKRHEPFRPMALHHRAEVPTIPSVDGWLTLQQRAGTTDRKHKRSAPAAVEEAKSELPGSVANKK